MKRDEKGLSDCFPTALRQSKIREKNTVVCDGPMNRSMWATHSVANFLRITWDSQSGSGFLLWKDADGWDVNQPKWGYHRISIYDNYPTPTSCEYILFFLLSHLSQECIPRIWSQAEAQDARSHDKSEDDANPHGAAGMTLEKRYEAVSEDPKIMLSLVNVVGVVVLPVENIVW